jgi:hypothetical protein
MNSEGQRILPSLETSTVLNFTFFCYRNSSRNQVLLIELYNLYQHFPVFGNFKALFHRRLLSILQITFIQNNPTSKYLHF